MSSRDILLLQIVTPWFDFELGNLVGNQRDLIGTSVLVSLFIKD